MLTQLVNNSQTHRSRYISPVIIKYLAALCEIQEPVYKAPLWGSPKCKCVEPHLALCLLGICVNNSIGVGAGAEGADEIIGSEEGGAGVSRCEQEEQEEEQEQQEQMEEEVEEQKLKEQHEQEEH